jgi:hypothetical protein
MHGKYLRNDIPIRKPNSSSNFNGEKGESKKLKRQQHMNETSTMVNFT